VSDDYNRVFNLLGLLFKSRIACLELSRAAAAAIAGYIEVRSLSFRERIWTLLPSLRSNAR